jgi:hypothetical protein
MSIKSDVLELNMLRSEIKSLKLKIKSLREKEKAAEKRISDFLKSRDQPGVKFQGTAVILEEKSKSIPKKNKEKDADSIAVLQRLGVEEPEKALLEILAARKGESFTLEKLKVAKYKS